MKKLLANSYIEPYKKKQKYSLAKHYKELAKHSEGNAFAFKHSSVFSSLIEGSGIDLDSYLFNKETNYQSKTMQQIDDLIEAYKFAKTHRLNETNLYKVHAIISRNFDMHEAYKGKLRDKEVRVGNSFETVYRGARVEILSETVKQFFSELQILVKRKNFTYDEAFYYASLVHLVFVKIHPFADGNGRVARLLEKWVLALLLDKEVWKIPSEAHYYLKRDVYYKNLKAIGKDYETLDYGKAVPFLLMLPYSFGLSKKYYKYIHR